MCEIYTSYVCVGRGVHRDIGRLYEADSHWRGFEGASLVSIR